MVEAAFYARQAPHSFERTQRMKALLDSGGMCLESFMNELMRKTMEDSGKSEKDIRHKLKSSNLPTKIEKWPQEVCSKAITSMNRSLDQHRALRNRLVHPKEDDHSIYLDLQHTKPDEIVDEIATFIVSICEAKPCIYPYWALGWNFVGFNRDPAHPVLLDSFQFVHAMARMKFLPVSSAFAADESEAWQYSMMANLSGFSVLKAQLDAISYDIEPWFELIPGLGAPPRLCRRWWQREFILSTVPGQT
jgi:hypothetical protein